MRLSPANRVNKTVDPVLYVHAWTQAGFRLAGRLELEEMGDRDVAATFRYDPSYLDAAADGVAYALDPLNMPLAGTTYATTSPHVVLGAIFDAAPDAWGRRVARSLTRAADQDRIYRNAFLRGADGIGALLITPFEHTNLDRIVAQSLAERPAVSQIEAAALAARQLETEGEVDEQLEDMLAGSWTIGGARPKAILRDDRPGAPAGRSVIAKFAPAGDTVGRNGLEWACLEMAADIGLPVPERALLEVAGQQVLLLSRFDRGDGAGGGEQTARRHYVSAMSFVSAEPKSKWLDTDFDRAVFSWEKLLEVTSRVAAAPAAARVEMFAHLALNAALSNTDDHLKNYGFLLCRDDPHHFEIAPVFDVSPQQSASHYLHCADLGRHYTLADLLPQARHFGVAAKAAREVGERIVEVLQRRMDYFDRAGLSERQAEQASALIERGLGPGLGAKAQRRNPQPHEREGGGPSAR